MRRKWILFGIILVIVLLCGKFAGGVQEQQRFESWIPWNKKKVEDKIIRVLLKNNGFQGITHGEVKLSAEHGVCILFGEETLEISPGEVFCIPFDSELFQMDVIRVKPIKETDSVVLHHLQRGLGVPSYQGELDLYWTEEGIVIVNEIDVEAYLEKVVPSEMPSSYEVEALKAQAVCARSYAYRQLGGLAYPEYQAHVDDSTSYQVYGNSEKREKTTEAVKETAGEAVWYKDEIAATYFYSTSSGKTAGLEAWNVKNVKKYPYLKSITVANKAGVDYEKTLPWYRWHLTVSKEMMRNAMESYAQTQIGTLEKLEVVKTGDGGIVLQVRAVGSADIITVETENKIRKALGERSFVIVRQDGSEVSCADLLPSAFFTIQEEGDSYVLNGGGYGHGIGMSQNGANEMAKDGKNYREIIEFFYPGTRIK